MTLIKTAKRRIMLLNAKCSFIFLYVCLMNLYWNVLTVCQLRLRLFEVCIDFLFSWTSVMFLERLGLCEGDRCRYGYSIYLTCPHAGCVERHNKCGDCNKLTSALCSIHALIPQQLNGLYRTLRHDIVKATCYMRSYSCKQSLCFYKHKHSYLHSSRLKLPPGQ